MDRTVQVVTRVEQAAAMLDATRLRLLHELRQPESASGLARRLGLSRQRVNYHLRELEGAGLVRLVREQKKGNCTERVVQAAGAFALHPELLGDAGRGSDLSETRLRFASEEDRRAFWEDLESEIAKLAAEYHDPGGERAFSVVVNGYSAASE